MINHVRTLLRNLRGAGWSSQYPGEEYAPPTYAPVALSGALQSVRNLLFGGSPDKAYLNYRLQQYLSLLHNSPLVEFVTALDPRITYNNLRADFLSSALYLPRVLGNQSEAVQVFGTPQAPDSTGAMLHRYTVTAATGELTVDRLTPIAQTGSGSGDAELYGSGYYVRVADDVDGTWEIDIYNRPQWDLGQIVANLTTLGADVIDALFGTAIVEPYVSWRDLWEQQRALPTRLGAVLLALAYRTEERRSHASR